MILIGFAILFAIVSCGILLISDYMLRGYDVLNIGESCYETRFVKGTTRGSMGNFESNSMLEAKRAQLQRKRSKF